jgi:hypothetical protein
MARKFVLLEDDETQTEYLDSVYGPGGSRPPPQAAAPTSGRFVLLEDEPDPSTPVPPTPPSGPNPGEMLDQSAAFGPSLPQPPPAEAGVKAGASSPLEGMSDWERAKAGTGKTFSDTGHGIVQLGADLGNFISDDLVPYKTTEDLRRQTDEREKRDAPLMADPYGRGGNIAGHVVMGTALPARTIPTAIASATGYGASQPVGVNDSRTDNAYATGAFGILGTGVSRAIGRSLKPVRTEVDRRTDKLFDYAEKKGFEFSAGQRTGSRHLQNAEAALDTLPTSGSRLAQIHEHNQKVANRIVGKEMGEDADAITPDVIEGARTRIGAEMDRLTQGRHFNADRPFFDDIFRIRTQYGQTLRGQQSAEIRSVLDELAAGSGYRSPQISAEQYQRTASALKSEAEASFRSGANVNDAQVKREIAEALERLAERNFTGDELAAFREARRQYSATLIAEKAVRPDGSGDIVLTQLHQATKKHRRVANRQGEGDELVKLGRLGHHLRKNLIPNSGTAERSWWLRTMQNPVSNLAPSATLGTAGAVGGSMMGDNPLLGAGLGLGTPWLLSRGMYSPAVQAWLRKGLPVPGRNQLSAALSRTGPGVASGATASGGLPR